MKKDPYTKKISVSPAHRKILIEEFGTRQTVHFALIYFTQSELANQIRARAKELLMAEAKKIEV